MVSGDRSILQGKKGAFWYTLEELSKKWERIDILCPKIQGPNSKIQSPAVFFGNVHFHASPYTLWNQPKWIVEKGTELVRIHHHDVMTVHEYPPFYNGIGARKLSRATGVPYVLEVHHIVGYPVAATFTEWIGRIMSWVYLSGAIRRSAACRAVSKGTAETLMQWGAPERKVRVVPSFYLDRSLVSSLGSAPAARVDVVFCGRLVANKGVSQLLHAMVKVPKATLLIIGDGPERQKLKSEADRLKIAHRVEFRGWIPTQQDVLQAIRSAKMLVMNSTSEGGPRVPLEAMACGVPVIVTKVGVMPDVITDGVNGLFTTGEADDVAEKINALLQHPALREAMGREATKILERFERVSLIGRYADFLKSFARS